MTGTQVNNAPASPPYPLTLEGIHASGRYIRGNAATPEDVASYKAVFSAGPDAKPLDLDIPQYATCIDPETDQPSLYVVTQAEEAGGRRLIGALRVSDGSPLAGFERDFQLLGHATNPPKNS